MSSSLPFGPDIEIETFSVTGLASPIKRPSLVQASTGHPHGCHPSFHNRTQCDLRIPRQLFQTKPAASLNSTCKQRTDPANMRTNLCAGVHASQLAPKGDTIYRCFVVYGKALTVFIMYIFLTSARCVPYWSPSRKRAKHIINQTCYTNIRHTYNKYKKHHIPISLFPRGRVDPLNLVLARLRLSCRLACLVLLV